MIHLLMQLVGSDRSSCFSFPVFLPVFYFSAVRPRSCRRILRLSYGDVGWSNGAVAGRSPPDHLMLMYLLPLGGSGGTGADTGVKSGPANPKEE
jgi:hypothetical protein